MDLTCTSGTSIFSFKMVPRRDKEQKKKCCGVLKLFFFYEQKEEEKAEKKNHFYATYIKKTHKAGGNKA